nr:sigma-70 family RNA polymerase sigma factor [Maliibacterium massiliense]
MDDITALYERYSGDVYRYARAMLGDAHAAEDVTQQTFLCAMRALAGFRGASSVKTWLIAICRRQCCDYLRKAPRTAAFVERASAQHLDDHLAAMDVLAQIHRLEEPSRQIMILRLVNDLPFEQIAQMVGRNPSTCRVLFYRAKKHLLEVVSHD